MSLKSKYVLYTLLDYALSFGGSALVVVLNYVEKDTSTGYKLTLGGIVLIVCLIFFAKAVFEKNYRTKLDELLQQLAMATDVQVKATINDKLEAHKQKNYIYQRITLLLPFAILFIVTYLGANALESLHQSAGLIIFVLGGGSVFNVIRQPLKSKISMEKLLK